MLAQPRRGFGWDWLVGCGILVGIVFGTTLPVTAATIPVNDLGSYQWIKPVSATVKHADLVKPAPASLYNFTGLDHRNPLMARHTSAAGTYWQEPIGDSHLPVSIEFDLGGEFLVNEMFVWQLRSADLIDQGIGQFDVLLYDSNKQLLGALPRDVHALAAAKYGPVMIFNAFGDCVFLPVPDCVRFVELRINSTLGSDQFVALGEVAFAGREKYHPVPEPAAGLLVGGALASLGWWRRREARGRSGRAV